MNLHYYCINCDVVYSADEVDDDNGTTYCIWCDSEDLMLIGSEPTPSYIINDDPLHEQLTAFKSCSCEDYPCCGH